MRPFLTINIQKLYMITYVLLVYLIQVSSCRYIATPQNGRRLDQNYWPGQMTVFECNHGYRMVGNSRLLCMTNWEWDPEEPPKCERE